MNNRIPALGMLVDRMVLTFPSQPSTLTEVAVENSRAGPTQSKDLKYDMVKFPNKLKFNSWTL